MILYKDLYDRLNQMIDGYTRQFRICMIEGDYGKGKSTLIQQVLKNYNTDVLDIKQYPGMNTPYEALSSALLQCLEVNNYNIGDLNLEISYREYLKQLCISICRQSKGIILFFEDIREYDNVLFALMKELLLYLSRHNLPCCLLLEYSSDNLSTVQMDDLIELRELCENTLIKINTKEFETYEAYINNFLNGENKIAKEQLDRIIKEAFYNPALIKKILYYFIDIGIIYQEGDEWFSEDLTFQLTGKLFEKHIIQRYNMLSPELKDTLDKASITGYIIDSELLSLPFGVIRAEENLRRIERLSRLIMHSEQNFLFENETVYNLINSKISMAEQKSQHLLIASYLYDGLIAQKKVNSQNPHILASLYNISQHFQNAAEIEKALYILNIYIYLAYQKRNYDAAASAVREFMFLSKGRFPVAEQFLYNLTADLCIEIGNFTVALSTVSEINESLIPKNYSNWLQYKKAFCLFNSGYTSEAKITADSLTEKFDNHILEDTLLQIKLGILSAGMYHHFGDVRTASRRYEQASLLSKNNTAYIREYNHLLSISNMFLTEELAIIKIEEGMNYFKKRHFLFSYAKSANNVAVNYLYLYKLDKAEQYFEESSRIFETACTTSAHYPQNNLATVYAIQGNYEKALSLFEMALHHNIEFFSTMWITMNMAHCKRLLGEFDTCRQMLVQVQEKICLHKDNTLLLERNLNIAYGLLELDCNNAGAAYDFCLHALRLELGELNNDTYPIFLSQLLIEIIKLTDKPLPAIAEPYVHSFINDYHRNLLTHHAHWGNFLFWEA